MKNNLITHILNGCFFIMIVASVTTSLLSQVPFLEPINDSVTEWDFTDLYYKTNPKFKKNKLDTNIVIVNIGHLDRAGIARLLDQVNTYNPKVVGLDVRFTDEREKVGDNLLEEALKTTKNLVTVGVFEKDTLGLEKDGYFVKASHKRFAKHGVVGLSSLIPGEKNVIRSYFKYEDDKNGRIYSFPLEILKMYSPSVAKSLIANDEVEGFIKYQGHMMNYYHIDYDHNDNLQVYYLQPNTLGWNWTKADHDLNILSDKIVLLGIVGRNTYTLTEYFEDQYNSPMKSNLWSLNTPDMNGVTIIANILSMNLNHDVVTYLTGYEGVYGLLILTAFLLLVQYLHLKINIDNQMIDRGIALFVIFILIYISVKLFSNGIYINFTLSVFWLLFATDANEVYLKLYEPILPKLSLIGRRIFIYTPIFAFILNMISLGLDYFIGINNIYTIPNIVMVIYLTGFLIYGLIIKWQQRKVNS